MKFIYSISQQSASSDGYFISIAKIANIKKSLSSRYIKIILFDFVVSEDPPLL